MDSLSWFSGLALFGSLQGLILSIVVFLRKQHPGARFLAGFILILAYNELETFSWSSSIGSNFLLFDILPYVFVLALGPCLYFYIRSNTTNDVLSTRRMFLHFIPSFTQLLLLLTIYFYYLLVRDQAERPVISPTVLYNTLVSVSTPLTIAAFAIYLFKAWQLTKSIKNQQSLTIRWLKLLLIATSILTVAWATTTASAYFIPEHDGSLYYVLELLIICFLYWIGVIGYHRINSIRSNITTQWKTGLDEMGKQFESLCRIMVAKKLYLDPDLDQQKFSVRVGIQAKTLSTLLSNVYKGNFNDFINTYRVREVQRRLDEQSHRHLTISAIAFESGFNSNATFQRVFKSKVGTSPSAYAKLSETGK
jgi:AraC-like DNA-binding protein